MIKIFAFLLFSMSAIIANAQCQASFSYQYNPILNVTTFTGNAIVNDSSAYPIIYTWQLGDGTIDSGQFVTHSYPPSGNYNACLTVQTANGCSDTFCDSIIVSNTLCNTSFQYTTNPAGYAYFTSNAAINDTSDSPISYTWTFGDGSSWVTSSDTISHIYFSTLVNYQVCVTMQTANGCSSTFCDSLSFNIPNPCQAQFSSYQDSITVPPINPFIFTDLSIPGGSDSIVNWNWTFGNGLTSNLQNPVVTFATPGTYTNCLSITTSSGCTSSFCDSIVVTNNIPLNCQALYSYSIDTLSVPALTTLNFTSLSVPDSNSIISNYFWNFGDGTSSTQANPNHGFITGNYTVCLTITTNSGCTSTFCDSILVTTIPCQISVNLISQSPATIGGNDGFIESNVSGGTAPYSYLWNNGVTTGNLYNLTSGTYTLNITDANGCMGTYSATLYEPYDTTGGPIVDTLITNVLDTCLGFTPDSFYISNVVTDSINNIVTVTWVFTGGGMSESLTVAYQYFVSGNNAVVLTINCGTKILTTYMSFIYISASVGVEQVLADKNNILVYPVPFKDKLNVTFSGCGTVDIIIYDATGRIALLEPSFNVFGLTNKEINTSGLSSGFYVINIVNNGAAIQKQLIK